MKKYSLKLAFFTIICLFLSLLLFANVLDGIGIVLSLFFLLQFFFSIGKTIPFIGLISSSYWATCVLFPIAFSYLKYVFNIGFYESLEVQRNEYLLYALPSGLMFSFGLSIISTKKTTLRSLLGRSIANGQKSILESQLVFIIGVVFTFTYPYFPHSIRFIGFLFSNLLYISFFYFYFSKRKNRYIYIILIILTLLYKVVSTGMFTELFWWGLIYMFYVTFDMKISLKRKILLVIACIFILFFMQGTKAAYRSVVFKDKSQIGLNTFVASVSRQFKGINKEEVALPLIANVMQRGNQGYLSSKVMKHVPYNEPFAYGNTIISGIMASAIPRFLWFDKPQAGGKVSFERYTGQKLAPGVSMNIGPLGEGYANFGEIGVLYMFFYGLFLSNCFVYFIKICKKYPTAFFWLPLVFFQALRVETDLVSVLNSLTKGFVFFVFCYFLIKRILRRKIFSND